MPEDLMRYDQLCAKRLRCVVREALRRVESQAAGEHNFYTPQHRKFPAWHRRAHGQRYPREMTIVLQHQYETLSSRRPL